MLAKKYCIGLLAVLVLCGLTLPGLFPSGPSKTSMLANDGWIEGQVTDGTDPLPNAYVLYFMSSGGGGGGPLGTNLTDATGHYNLTVIGGIGYTVIAFHGDHYAASGAAAPDPGETVTLNLVEISISPLLANVIIKGFVLDTNRNPVLGGDVLGFTNDPITMGDGAPIYGNFTTADPLTGAFTVNVIPGTAGGGTHRRTARALFARQSWHLSHLRPARRPHRCGTELHLEYPRRRSRPRSRRLQARLACPRSHHPSADRRQSQGRKRFVAGGRQAGRYRGATLAKGVLPRIAAGQLKKKRRPPVNEMKELSRLIGCSFKPILFVNRKVSRVSRLSATLWSMK